MSRHLTEPRQTGLISMRRGGRHHFCIVDDPHVRALVQQIFAHAVTTAGSLAPGPGPSKSLAIAGRIIASPATEFRELVHAVRQGRGPARRRHRNNVAHSRRIPEYLRPSIKANTANSCVRIFRFGDPLAPIQPTGHPSRRSTRQHIWPPRNQCFTLA